MFENQILCGNCGKKTRKKIVVKDGFKLRAVECPNCGKKWFHPVDYNEYKKFLNIKSREFKVKLRMVGNSFCVSIPKEVINFEEIEKKMNQMIKMSLEEPRKLSLYFTSIRKVIK
jgi:DNA-directed RNA polymerase subunit RPC12/RpoP